MEMTRKKKEKMMKKPDSDLVELLHQHFTPTYIPTCPYPALLMYVRM